jgi:hypothetical protein
LPKLPPITPRRDSLGELSVTGQQVLWVLLSDQSTDPTLVFRVHRDLRLVRKDPIELSCLPRGLCAGEGDVRRS